MNTPVPGMTIPTSLSNLDTIKHKIAELQQLLQTQAPGYDVMLYNIHSALSKDESVVHLLSDEEIGTICAALSKKKGIILVEEKVKASGGKKPKFTSLEDLM